MGCCLSRDESHKKKAETLSTETMYRQQQQRHELKHNTSENNFPLSSYLSSFPKSTNNYPSKALSTSTSQSSFPLGFGGKFSDTKIDYKSRLEKKMCLAKETPELNYDLSDCNLKEIPSGVFILCRVLRKELLNLSKNKLIAFNTGGLLNDLYLLRTLNLQHNKIKQLPDEIYRLENLRELFISNNLLVKLPKTIIDLNHLELIDISFNNIESIDEIYFISNLKTLNLSGNKNLRKLPISLATCDNLGNLIIDIENFEWPSHNILSTETSNILNYLLISGKMTTDDNTPFDKLKNIELGEEAIEVNKESKISNILYSNSGLESESENFNSRSKYGESGDIINRSSFTINTCSAIGCESINKNIDVECENDLIKEIQFRQQKQKEELLKVVSNQQQETESLVNQIQQKKDYEKSKLIKDVLQAETNANLIIENLLTLKNSIDYNLLEREKIEEKRLLGKLHLNHSELRKQEILSTMLDVLRDEECKIQSYQNRKILSNHIILEKETESTMQLQQCIQQSGKNRSYIIQKICENEKLQKQAVINLIAKNDARTWGLVEQLRIVEAQLAYMTHLEIQKRKISNNEQLNELGEKRVCLIRMLTDLLDQQEIRKKQLYNTILNMEAQKSNEQPDFWLLQYQRLLDSRPLEFSVKTNSVDPLLGYNFLVNGVIHCLPFLQKLWHNSNIDLSKITKYDLKNAGIRNEKDRKLIIKSIEEYLNDVPNYNIKSSKIQYNCNNYSPTAPPISPKTYQKRNTNKYKTKNINNDDNIEHYTFINAASSTSNSNDKNELSSLFSLNTQNMPECVICMDERVKVIFLPCGHMCCCLKCQVEIENCPICRANIEGKVKVVQP